MLYSRVIQPIILCNDAVTMVFTDIRVVDQLVASGVCYVDSTSFIPFHPGVVDGDFTSPLVHSDTSTVVIVGDYGGVEGDLTAHVLDVYAVPCVVTGRGVNESKLFI